MTELDDELVQLREQLVEAQQLNKRLEKRLVELIHERSQLFHELDVCRSRRTALDLTDELRQFGILDADDEADDLAGPLAHGYCVATGHPEPAAPGDGSLVKHRFRARTGAR